LQTLLSQQVEEAQAQAGHQGLGFDGAAYYGDQSSTTKSPEVSVTPYPATHYSQHPLPPPRADDSFEPTTTKAGAGEPRESDTAPLPQRVYVPALITIADAEKSGDGQLTDSPHASSPYDTEGAGGDPRTLGSGGNNGGTKSGSGGSSGSGYIMYVIQVGDKWEVRRRYSEFESLRRALVRLYPTLIVPPIPEKHTLKQYAVLQSRTKDEPGMIARRKRMLQTFLNRLVRHPILASEHILHRFLEPGVAWSEVLHSPSLTNLPKNPLHLSPSSVAHRTAASADAAAGTTTTTTTTTTDTLNSGDVPLPPNPSVLLNVPIPSGLHPLKRPDPRWVECEYFTNRFANTFAQAIERPSRRVAKRWGEIALDYAELGAVYNGFSLTEVESLAGALEKVGQAVDSTFMSTNRLVGQFEADVTEPLHEYAQLATEIKQVLKYRNLKHLQLESVTDALQRKRDLMDDLEIADQEARRLNHALEAATTANPGPDGQSNGSATTHRSHRRSVSAHSGGANHDDDDDDNRDDDGEEEGNGAGGYPRGRPRSATNDSSVAAIGTGDPFPVHFRPTLGGDTAATGHRADDHLGGEGDAHHHDGDYDDGDDDNDDPWRQSQQAATGSRSLPHRSVETEEEDETSDQGEDAVQRHRGKVAASASEPITPQASSAGLRPSSSSSPPPHGSTHQAATSSLSKSSVLPTSSSGGPAAPSKRLSVGSGLIHRISYKLHGVIDVDPQATRRNTMVKTRDAIRVLEEQQELLTNDLGLINAAIQRDLDQFQRQKVRDLRDVLLAMAKVHIEWARKNKEAWEEVREEVRNISSSSS
ncbi:Sorting nexin, cytoplasm-to-vacuole targeting pathway/endosomal sorting, partial [Tieghemiomyces parasiticus]